METSEVSGDMIILESFEDKWFFIIYSCSDVIALNTFPIC